MDVKKTDSNLESLIKKVDEKTDKLQEHQEILLEAVKEDNSIQKQKDLAELLAEYESKTCRKVDKIYFLKTSKTGSTTVANILTRFGLRRPGTNFLMGETSNGGFFFKNGFLPFSGQGCLFLLLRPSNSNPFNS